MLEAIRKRSAGIVVKSLLGLLILSFAMWGIADVFSPGGTDQTLASVGEIQVEPEQVRREYNSEMERLAATFGARLEPEQARMFGVAQNVVKRIVERTLYDLAAQDLGVRASDNLVRTSISTQPAFQNEKGEFERARFQQVLQSNRLTEGMFVELTRGDVVRTQYLSMLDKAPLAAKRMTNSLYAFRNEKRIAETVTFKYDDIIGVPAPEDAALVKFHEENAQRYTAPEYRSLTFVSLTADDLAKEMEVADATIQQAYEDRLNEFSEPEKRKLQQIRFKDEAAAKAAHDRLKTGDDFLKVALELADMDAKATELGDMKKSELMPGMAEAAFALEIDEYTPPVKSVLGWHILRLQGVTSARQQRLEEVSDDIKKEIAAEKAIDSLYNLANQLEDELGGGSSLEEAAHALSLPITKQGDIDARGMTPGNSKVEGLPEGQFLETAFATPSGGESILTEAGNDGYFIVRVDTVTEPQLRPLQSVRSEVLEAWTAKQKRELARQQGVAMVDKLSEGGNFEALTSELGLKISTTEPIDRNGTGTTLPRELVTDLFETKMGQTAFAPGIDGFIVARLKSTVAADAASAGDKAKALSEELTNAIRADLMNQLAAALSKQYPVTMNTEAINAQF